MLPLSGGGMKNVKRGRLDSSVSQVAAYSHRLADGWTLD
jgi:hypothetical protein